MHAILDTLDVVVDGMLDRTYPPPTPRCELPGRCGD
jgi:hypothetical protein